MYAYLTSPFSVVTERIPLGTGDIVLDRYEDGEVIATTLVGARLTRPLRPFQAFALRAFVARIGGVVPYADLIPKSGKKASLRRDLGNLRSVLSRLGLEIDVVPHVGYRLRDVNTKPETISIGDLELDLEGRVVSCRGRQRALGGATIAALALMADGRPRDVAEIYRQAWRGEPHAVKDLVISRIASLRRILRALDSSVTIQQWTTHYMSEGRCKYFLRLLDRVDERTSNPVQLSLFDHRTFPQILGSTSWTVGDR